MSAAVAIEGIYKRFGDVHALRGLDLRIERGEFFGLLGPNGAGKSTLINILAGLARADEGRVSVMGFDVVRQYRRARQCLGLVPQELVFDPFFTVREVLEIQSGYFGLGKDNAAWIDELLAALMLEHKADANMRSLSGGMKRRVLIGQALVHKPPVVVLDEPTAGVDVELRQSLWDFVQRLHREGHTILLTTHYLEEAESLCGRIAIINDGAVVALDTKQGLLARGLGPHYYASFTLSDPVPQLPETLRPKVRRVDGNILELQLQRGGESVIQAMDALRAAGAVVVDVKTQETDLEDVFVELIRQQ